MVGKGDWWIGWSHVLCMDTTIGQMLQIWSQIPQNVVCTEAIKRDQDGDRFNAGSARIWESVCYEHSKCRHEMSNENEDLTHQGKWLDQVLDKRLWPMLLFDLTSASSHGGSPYCAALQWNIPFLHFLHLSLLWGQVRDQDREPKSRGSQNHSEHHMFECMVTHCNKETYKQSHTTEDYYCPFLGWSPWGAFLRHAQKKAHK